MAWLSNWEGSPSTRFSQSASLPYVLVDGAKVADSWADLIDGNLYGSIALDEHGDLAPSGTVAWTYTSRYGTAHVGNDYCLDWSSAGPSLIAGEVGSVGVSDEYWTEGPNVDCAGKHALYCFQQ